MNFEQQGKIEEQIYQLAIFVIDKAKNLDHGEIILKISINDGSFRIARLSDEVSIIPATLLKIKGEFDTGVLDKPYSGSTHGH